MRMIVALLSAGWLASGCTEPAPEEKGSAPAASTQKSAPSAPAKAPKHEHGHNCGEPIASKLAHNKLTTRKGPKGEMITHAGKPFEGAVKVAVEKLIRSPDAYKGKKVQITGDVSAMCHGKRRWFAIVAGDKSGRFVRVMTSPVFLVPHGSIGKSALAEGTVDVIEVSARAARYFAKGHKLGKADDVKGPVKQVILRATGAEFSS